MDYWRGLAYAQDNAPSWVDLPSAAGLDSNFVSKTLSSFNHILTNIIVNDPCDRDRFSVLHLIGRSVHCWFLKESVEHSIPFLLSRLALSPVWRLPHCPAGMLHCTVRHLADPSGPVSRYFRIDD